MSYPWGYFYPNELVEGAGYGTIVWLPIIAVYMTMIALASGSFILLSLGSLLDNRFIARISPVLFSAGLALALVYLLGPLADLRRPDQFYRILTGPHILPSSSHPGISMIALIATVMWPLLLILAILLALATGLLPRFKVTLSKPVVKLIAFLLLIVAIVWSTYPALLLFTSVYVMTVYNFLPLLPLEAMLQSIAVGAGLAAALMTAHRLKAGGEEVRLLALFITAATGAYVFFRFVELLRLRVYTGGGGVAETLLEALEPYSTIVLVLALVIFALGALGIARPSRETLALAGILGILWVLVDRWVVVVNTQTVSRTLLAVIPAEISLGAWVLESIGMVLLSIGIYLVLAWYIVPVRVEGAGAGGGSGE